MNARALLLAALVATSACGEPAPESPHGVGNVRIATVLDAIGREADLTTIDARFERPGSRAQCEQAWHGACVVFRCIEDEDRVTPDAGELDVRTADERFVQKLGADSRGAYAFGDESNVFAAGDEIAVEFAGAEVPAFAVAGVFPEPLVASEPVAPSDRGTTELSPLSDFNLRWAPGGEESSLSVSAGAAPAWSLRCLVPVARGALTIAASALAALEEGPVDVRTVRHVTARAGSYDITLLLEAAVVDADGNGRSFALVR
jgi:hypothetical protein